MPDDVFIGRLPYGNYILTVVEVSEAEALAALGREFRRSGGLGLGHNPDTGKPWTFDGFYEYAGGCVEAVSVGQVVWV